MRRRVMRRPSLLAYAGTDRGPRLDAVDGFCLFSWGQAAVLAVVIDGHKVHASDSGAAEARRRVPKPASCGFVVG
jgi:hypothetical protein